MEIGFSKYKRTQMFSLSSMPLDTILYITVSRAVVNVSFLFNSTFQLLVNVYRLPFFTYHYSVMLWLIIQLVLSL